MSCDSMTCEVCEGRGHVPAPMFIRDRMETFLASLKWDKQLQHLVDIRDPETMAMVMASQSRSLKCSFCGGQGRLKLKPIDGLEISQ